ncbi:MAG: hypothetical protein A2Y90_03010 [Chloroflexi bacterium RBG_13_52_12]|nr:MAG: hypothetical protein A2Y90_03010 [Chloroflexi bacterium RBG_13_52_12]
MEQKYQEGQRVKIITLIDGFGRSDPRVTDWVGKTGEVVKYYYASFSEVWEKTLKPADTYCYNVRLDESGEIARGIPEVGLEALLSYRK